MSGPPDAYSNFTNSLRRIYNDEFYEIHLNVNAPFYQLLQTLKNVAADGAGFYFPFYLATPQNQGFIADGGNLPSTVARTEVQAFIQVAMIVNSFEIGFILEAAGNANAAFNKGEIKRHMWEATTDATKHLNRCMAFAHGTNRLAVVNGTVAASSTWVGALPYGVLGLRQNMRLDFYNLDTGGAIQLASQQISITPSRATNTVTMTAPVSLTAGWGAYNQGDYGNGINGLEGIVDNGVFLTNIHNQSRSTQPGLNSTVLSNGGNLRPLSELLLIRLANEVLQNSGQEIDALLMNSGQIEQYINFVLPNRRYNVTGKGVPAYQTGFQEGTLEFLWGGGKVCEIKCMEDIVPRNVFGVTKAMLGRNDVRKLSWYDDMGPILRQGVGSTGYRASKIGTIGYIGNWGTRMPAAHGVIRDLSDPELCGDPSV
jgi:hypothetical protein